MVQVFPSPSLPTIKATLKYLKPNQPGQSLSLFLIQPIHSKLEKTPFNLFSLSLSLNVSDTDEMLYYYVNQSDRPQDQLRENFTDQAFDYKLQDFRQSQSEFNLSNVGFQFLSSHQSVAKIGDGSESRVEWNDDQWVQDVYYKEVESF